MTFQREKTSIKPLLTISLLFLVSIAFISPPGYAQLTSDDIADLQKEAVDEGWTFTIRENSATQYSLEQLCGLKIPDNWRELAPFDECAPKRDLPSSFDWRTEVGGLPVVKQQGGCGSCWAFATVGPLECNIKIKDGMIVDLSEQWLVNCNTDGWDCTGGWYAHDYHQFKTDACGGTGAVFEDDCPYVAYLGSCNCPYTHHYVIESWAYVGSQYGIPTVDAMKQAIMDHGPLSVGVHANSALQAYGGGIFNGCDENGELNHAVTLVGWDDSQGTEGVWFVRNSWGTGWGEDGGYGRLEYGCSSIGYAAAYIVYAGADPLYFEYPSGIPEIVMPEQTTAFAVKVIPGSGTPISGTGQLHYSINGEEIITEAMIEAQTNIYMAVLPAIVCGDTLAFYVSAEDVTEGRMYDPVPDAPNVALPATDVVTIFADDFETDQGWTVSGNAVDGHWDRGVPAGAGERGDPPTDYDGSGSCFLTDNVYGNSDVDNGTTYLDSPVFDLTSGDGLVHYARWYSNDYGSSPYIDVMRVYVSNDSGYSWVKVDSAGPTANASGGWFEHTFSTGDFVTPGAFMRLRFEASDIGDGSVVEAGVDDLSITVYICEQSNAPVISTDSLPDWTVAIPYSQQLTADNGTGTLTWSDKNGDLDGTGLMLSSNGQLDGTPVSIGTISFTAVVTDEELENDEKFFAFEIFDEVLITTSPLPDWTRGFAFSQQLRSTGGAGGILWSDLNGDLSGTGLALASNGLLSGTPEVTGTIRFTAHVVDQAGSYDEAPCSLVVNPAITIATTSLPDWTVGIAYEQPLDGSGGTGTLAWSDKNDDLVSRGLILVDTGVLAGTPLDTGLLSFIAVLADSIGAAQEQELSFTVNAPVSIVTDSLPDGIEGYEYSLQLESVGGTGVLIWSDSEADLDGTGLALSPEGVLSGNPLSRGIIQFTAMVIDAPGAIDSREYTLTIKAPYICGDANNDEGVNLLDILFVIDFVYNDGPSPEHLEAADVNNSGETNLLDILDLIQHLYGDGTTLHCP
ncbi:MAG: hypothetical protein JW763_04885 [candidate division Zixibacteria bacterium]|nr:hypothetical protein [candidate division Zixibacteria bacterium]